MKTLTTGPYEDIAALGLGHIATQAELIYAALVTFRGKTLPTGSEREAWWRDMDLRLRQYLIYCYNSIHSANTKEMEDFFSKAETMRDIG